MLSGRCGEDAVGARVGLPSIADQIDEGLSLSRELIGVRIVMSLVIRPSVHDGGVDAFRAGLLLSRRRLRLPLPPLLMEVGPEAIEDDFVLA